VRLEHDDAPFVLENLSSQARSPAEHAEFADALSEAFMIVLDHLAPTERVVFLLREAFEFDYEDIASVVDRSEENCRQILKRARVRIAARETTATPDRERDEHIASEFIDAAETGKLDRLLHLLSAGAALARDPGDLSKPVPPLIHDREILFQLLQNTLAQIRNGSDPFVVLPIGHHYAYVARCGRIAKGAILLRLKEQKVTAVRLVSCPVLLHRLQILMIASPGGDCQPGDTYRSN
jgi:RNA polymerase sigma-70 factor (ECF subfamily)